MDTPIAIYFRYFWLELLRLPEAREALAGFVPEECIDLLSAEARIGYLQYLRQEGTKEMKRSHPEWPAEKQQREACKAEDSRLGAALVHWFNWNQDEYTDWLEANQPGRVSVPDKDSPQGDTGSPEVPDAGSPDGEVGVIDLSDDESDNELEELRAELEG